MQCTTFSQLAKLIIKNYQNKKMYTLLKEVTLLCLKSKVTASFNDTFELQFYT
jgi:hypothetical protein